MKEHIQKVFLPFPLEAESKGTGIWLSRCAERVNNHANLISYNAFN